MSDDSFIREVNEELRRDQLKGLWQRTGSIIIGAAVVIVLATAGYVAYDHWSTSRANSSGDAFAQALDLGEEGNTEEALAVLEELEASGYGAYPMLAKLRAATLLARNGEPEEAVAKFDAVANDSSHPDALRDMARLRAALLLVDHGSYADVASRAEPLMAEGNAMRHTAREVLALAAMKEGDRENARVLLDEILNDPQAPQGMRERAQMLSELIAGSEAESG